jgi:hypothetical protein
LAQALKRSPAAAARALRTCCTEHDEIHRASTQRARKPRSAKAKGRAGVVEVAAMVCAAFGLEPADIQIQTTSVGGSDLHLSPAALRWFPFAPEIKNVESLNIHQAMKQARINAEKKSKKIARPVSPITFFRRNGTQFSVALDARLFLSLLSDIRERNAQAQEATARARPAGSD